MILPNPSMDFTPFDVLTAAELDDLVENDQAIATGLNDGTALTSIRKNNLTIDSNPYKFSVYRNAAQNSPNNTYGKVQFDTELFDTNNNYDNATNFRYTAPVAGFYQINSAVSLTSGGLVIGLITLYKNGTEYIRGTQNVPQSASAFSMVLSTVIQLAASDYIETFIFSNTTTSIAVGASPILSYMNGYLVCRT